MQPATEKTLTEVTLLSDAYERALAENDLEALDCFFYNGAETVRYGVGENLYGADEIAAFRRARRAGSPPRTVIRRVITLLGNNAAVISLEFKRDNSSRTGRQQQTWYRSSQGWKIVAAHVSLMAEQSEAVQPAS